MISRRHIVKLSKLQSQGIDPSSCPQACLGSEPRVLPGVQPEGRQQIGGGWQPGRLLACCSPELPHLLLQLRHLRPPLAATLAVSNHCCILPLLYRSIAASNLPKLAIDVRVGSCCQGGPMLTRQTLYTLMLIQWVSTLSTQQQSMPAALGQSLYVGALHCPLYAPKRMYSRTAAFGDWRQVNASMEITHKSVQVLKTFVL